MFEPKFTCYREINTATDCGEAKLDPPSTSLPQTNKTPSRISGMADSEKHWQRSEQEQPALPEWFRQKQPEKNCHRPLSSLVPRPPSSSWSSSYLQSARYLAMLKAGQSITSPIAPSANSLLSQIVRLNPMTKAKRDGNLARERDMLGLSTSAAANVVLSVAMHLLHRKT